MHLRKFHKNANKDESQCTASKEMTLRNACTDVPEGIASKRVFVGNATRDASLQGYTSTAVSVKNAYDM
jgi:hypothetical protein